MGGRRSPAFSIRVSRNTNSLRRAGAKSYDHRYRQDGALWRPVQNHHRRQPLRRFVRVPHQFQAQPAQLSRVFARDLARHSPQERRYRHMDLDGNDLRGCRQRTGVRSGRWRAGWTSADLLSDRAGRALHRDADSRVVRPFPRDRSLEPFTHAFTSLALARAGQRRLPRFGTAMLVVSGLASDLDYVSYLGGASAFMRFHRTVLHSIPGAVVDGLRDCRRVLRARSKAASAKDNQLRSKTLLLRSRFGACVRDVCRRRRRAFLLDLASGVGIQPLWPFRVHWSAWNLVSDLDLWILILLVLGLLLPLLFVLVNEEVGARKKGRRRRRGCDRHAAFARRVSWSEGRFTQQRDRSSSLRASITGRRRFPRERSLNLPRRSGGEEWS